jgi:hypothetical protein
MKFKQTIKLKKQREQYRSPATCTIALKAAAPALLKLKQEDIIGSNLMVQHALTSVKTNSQLH